MDAILRSEAQIVLFWGQEFVAVYNDAYAPTIGDKHPHALGRPAREHWAELWDDLGPLLERVRDTGETFRAKDRPFYIERHGYGEKVYFDVSYSLVGEVGEPDGGIMCIVQETTERVLADRRIRESEERFRALVDATTDIVFRMSADWQDLIQLEGKSLLPDLDDAESNWLQRFIPAEDQPALDNEVKRAVATETPFFLEHRVRLADGRDAWFRTRAVPIRGPDGSIAEWFGAAASITEQRKQRQHLELVIHELDHRVKNSLAMVQAIARRTFSSHGPNATAHDVFLQRLQAIARANRLLTGSGGAADLATAIEEAVYSIAPCLSRLACDGPPVQLTQRTALAVTLALHELATNAVRHGAWSSDAGRVSVRWTYDPEQPLPLMVTWREQDGPSVQPPRRRGFGTTLISRAFSNEIDGDVELTFDPAGVQCTFKAPRSALTEG